MHRGDGRAVEAFRDAVAAVGAGRCVVVTEAQGFAGVGAEIAARVSERAFHSLAAPVLRVSGLDIPYPAPKLEHIHLPGVDRVLGEEAGDEVVVADIPLREDVARVVGEVGEVGGVAGVGE